MSGPGQVPILEFLVPPVTGDRGVSDLPRDPLSPYLEIVAQAVDVPLDPSRGAITFDVVDCSNQPAGGASVTLEEMDDATTQLYFDAYAPVIGEGMTDAGSAGLGMFLNVPAGHATLTVTIGQTHRWVSEVVVLSRPGALSTVRLPPTPRPRDPGVIGAP